MVRYIAFSIILTAIYSILHCFLVGAPAFSILLFNCLISFTYFMTICLIWHVGEQSKKTRFLNVLCSILFLLPLGQVAYFMTYKGFISTELYAFILRELSFLWEMVVTGFSWIGLIGGLAVLIINYFIMKFALKIREKGIDYLFLFKKWYILLIILGVEIQQVMWCVKRDITRLPERIMIPVTVIFILSVLIRAILHKRALWKKVIFIAIPTFNLLVNVFYSRPPFTKLRDSSTLDIRFFQSTFAAIYNGSPVKVLTQGGEALEAFDKLPATKLDYNVLVILIDAMRFDSLTASGYERNTDRNLQWLFKKSVLFNYAISPANMTDTSIPTMFTGIGTNKDVVTIKNSLRLWDYYKDADTFYHLTGDKEFASIDKFLMTKGMDNIWSFDDGTQEKVNVVTNGDGIAADHIAKYANSLKKNFIGIWHADATHSYIKYPGPKEYLIFDRNDGKSEAEKRKINYDNAIHYGTSMVSKLLKSIDLKNTVVVITADHGEGFGEHGYFFHNQDYHQEAVRVPFIWHIPSRLKKEISKDAFSCFEKNSKGVVSTLDLVPTLLGLHKEAKAVDLFVNPHPYSGKNLFKCQPKDRVVFSSHCLNGYRCYKRNILFASKDYSVIYDPAKGLEGIYSTFGDIKQVKPLELEAVRNDPKFKNVVEQATELHPIGRMLDAFLKR